MRVFGIDRFDVGRTGRDGVKVSHGQTGENITLELKIHFEIFLGRKMLRDLSHDGLEHGPMKDEQKCGQDRERNLCTTFPSSARRNRILSILAHEGVTLFP